MREQWRYGHYESEDTLLRSQIVDLLDINFSEH